MPAPAAQTEIAASGKYSCGPGRSTTALSTLHLHDRYQPSDLRAATRAVLRTSTYKLMLALAYLNGHATGPVKMTRSPSSGRMFITDGHDGRIFEIASCIEAIEQADLDPRVVLAVRDGCLTDEEAFAVLASGTTIEEARRYAESFENLPPVESLLTVAALRGIDVTGPHDN